MGKERQIVEGKLTSQALGGILKKLEGNRSAAYLLVSDGLAEKCVFFSVGAMRLSATGRRRGRRLLDVVKAHPQVSPEVFERATEKAKELSQSVEEVLASYFEKHELIRDCAAQILRDELLDIITWEGAIYEYSESNPPPKIFDPRLEAVKLSFGAATLVKEAEEAIARWQKISAKLGGARARLAPGVNAVLGASGELEGAVRAGAKLYCEAVVAAEGRGIPIEDLFLEGRRRGIDVHAGMKALEALLDAKAVELAKRASDRISPEEERAQWKREAEEVEGALDLLINELVARQRLAQSYEQLGDQRRAVFNLKKVGDELVLRGRSDDAISIFRRVVKLVPSDFSAREKIVQLLERAKRIPDAIAEGLDLAGLYRKFGLVNRAKNVYRYLISLDARSIDLRRMLIDLLVRLKENKNAVAEYEQIAALHREQGGGEDDLLAIYQAILGLDPQNQLARRNERSIVRRRLSFILPLAGVVLGLVLVAGLGLWLSFEHGALKVYRRVKEQVFAKVDHDDFRGALDELDGFLREHEWSRLRGRAAELRDTVVLWEKDRLERRAREDYGEAQRLFAAGSVREARVRFQRLLTTAQGTTFARDATDRLREIEQLEDEAKRMASLVDRLVTDAREARTPELMRELEARAFDKARDLLRRFPWSDAASSVQVPVRFETVPSRAQVIGLLDQAARTPISVLRRPGIPFDVTFRLDDGYAPATLSIDLRSETLAYTTKVELQKKLRWRVPTRGPIEAPPLVAEDTVYICGRDQRLYAIDRETGKVKWQKAIGIFGEAAGPPLVASGRVIVGDRTGRVVAFDAATEARVFRVEGVCRGWATPLAAVDGVVAVADEAAGELVGLDLATGAERWRFACADRLPFAPAAGPGGKTVYAAAADGTVHAVEVRTGKELARSKLAAEPSGPAAYVPEGPGVPAPLLLVPTDDGALRALAAADAKLAELWRVALPAVAGTAPAVAGGVAFVGAGEQLLALDLAGRGAERWRAPIRGGVRATPAVERGRVYVGGADGTVHCLVADKDKPLGKWVFKTGAEIVAAPVASDGTLYCASTDGSLYAVSLERE